MVPLPTTDPAADPADRAGDPCTGVVGPRSLTVYHDPGCELCRRCRAWLEVQATWVPLAFVAADAEEAQRLLPQVPWLGTELVVIGDEGETWIGPAAFLTCLWATRRYRGWSHRLAGPSFAPLAERFFHVVSSNRGRVAAVLRADECADGTCRHRPGPDRSTAVGVGIGIGIGIGIEPPASTVRPAPPRRVVRSRDRGRVASAPPGWPPGWVPPPRWTPPPR